jgi:hypothetical protein
MKTASVAWSSQGIVGLISFFCDVTLSRLSFCATFIFSPRRAPFNNLGFLLGARMSQSPSSASAPPPTNALEQPTSSPVIAATPLASSSTLERSAPATKTAANKKSTAPPPPDHNPRWKGYTFILLSSLINIASVRSIPADNSLMQGRRGVALSFGIVTFIYSLCVLVTDRLQLGVEKFHYMKVWDGVLEGVCLCIGTLYSVVAVAYMTQVKGIAYLTLNIYFSVWFLLISFVYTLNKWSTAKDILSIRELTGVSATLKSWYIVFLSSMVVTGSSINMLIVLANYQSRTFYENENARSATLGIVFGFCSTVLSCWFILSHYNLIECTNEGGWVELLFIVIVILIWLIAIAVLTDKNSIAATISGSGCSFAVSSEFPEDSILDVLTSELLRAEAYEETPQCELIIHNITYSCGDLWDNFVAEATNDIDTIPGSNLYFFLWICLLASLNLASRWKAQQALQFAHTQEEKARKAEMETKKAKDGNDNDELDESDDEVNDYVATDRY